MNITRKGFLGLSGCVAAGAVCAVPSTGTVAAPAKKAVAAQLYSIGAYIRRNGLERALAEVAKIGYRAVEFVNYFGKGAPELKRLLDANGLVACGTHVHKRDLGPGRIKAVCEFNLAYGNSLLVCAGAGNFPRRGENVDEFMKRHVDHYNAAAEAAARYGCRVGLHNHTPEFDIRMSDGTTYWDYFFTHTRREVCMEQDVGWTACTGRDPCEEWRKYPHRSITMHAKEDNGRRLRMDTFDGVLGRPAANARGVDWKKVSAAADADGVKWWIAECEAHLDSLTPLAESFKFLQRLGRC